MCLLKFKGFRKIHFLRVKLGFLLQNHVFLLLPSLPPSCISAGTEVLSRATDTFGRLGGGCVQCECINS